MYCYAHHKMHQILLAFYNENILVATLITENVILFKKVTDTKVFYLEFWTRKLFKHYETPSGVAKYTC